MKTITQFFGADLDWVDTLAKQLEGEVKGNFIIVPDKIQTGNRYFLDCGEGIVTYFANGTYHTELHFIQRNHKTDFIGIYYDLSKGHPKIKFDGGSNELGDWGYNLAIIDSSAEYEYNIKKGSESYVFCIFIKKETLQSYAQKHKSFNAIIGKLLDSKQNFSAKWGRMSDTSYQMLMDLQKLEVGGKLFNLNLLGTVHLLISDYLNTISDSNRVDHLVDEREVRSIIFTQKFLMENLKKPFPSNQFLALKINMSESKFKDLFKKITGSTANTFYMNNKFIKAKELLEENQLSIKQVSDTFNFPDSSYFILKFKEHFGMSPKKFIKNL
jgi:AraC-like DNA-binding protein